MYKRSICVFSLMLGVWTILLFAQATGGRVIDIFGKNVTVRMDSPIMLKAGDTIDLTYAADTMEFQIGRYEVVQIKGNVFIAKELSSSMPPSQEMKVRVVRSAANAGSPPQKPAASRAPAPASPRKGDATATSPYGKLPPLPDENDPYLNGSSSPQPAAPVPENKPAPSISPKKPAKVAVLGPDEGVDPSAPPTGRTGYDQAVAPPQGQQGMGKSSNAPDTIDLLGMSQWKEITFADYKRQLIEQNKKKPPTPTVDAQGRPVRPRLGIAIRNNESPIGQAFAGSSMGIRVMEVTPGSPAEKNGIEVADIIYEIDNIKVTSSDMFTKYIISAKGRIHLKIQRDGELLEKSIPLSSN
jgi:hypothetical protein